MDGQMEGQPNSYDPRGHGRGPNETHNVLDPEVDLKQNIIFSKTKHFS